MKSNIIILGVIAALFVLVLSIGGYAISVVNTEVSLRNQFNAQLQSNEVSFDKMWKIIQQQTGVAETERETFKETYGYIMQSRQGIVGNASLASFLTESKVDISPDLFKQLMNTIESQRESFNNSQKRLIDIKREHDNLRMTFPSGMLVGSRPELEIKLITSDKTEEVFASGKENL